jgi:hypothetical protein
MKKDLLVAVSKQCFCCNVEELRLWGAFAYSHLVVPAFHAAATIRLTTWSQGMMSATLLSSATTIRKTPFDAPAMKPKPPVCTLSIQPDTGSFRVPKTEIYFAQNKS